MSENPTFAHRSLMVSLMTAGGIPALFGIRFRVYNSYILWVICWSSLAHWALGDMHGVDISSRVYLSLWGMGSVFVGIGRMQQVFFRSLYSTEQKLLFEN